MAKKGQKFRGKPGEKVKRGVTKILMDAKKQAIDKDLDEDWDKKLEAQLPGRRESQFGNIYYEYRPNRTDLNPKNKL